MFIPRNIHDFSQGYVARLVAWRNNMMLYRKRTQDCKCDEPSLPEL